jgi:ATP-dependent helicase/nuclease subunit A
VNAEPTLRGPNLIGASAGSGKTTHLTQLVTRAVDSKQSEPVDLEGLVAVTYTKKGAAELASRIRQSFALSGAHQTTHRLPLAYIGTVHAVCLRLVKEFAIDAGLSPLVDVVPGGEERLLRQSLESGLEPALRRRLDELAHRFDLLVDNKKGRVNWFGPVQEIMSLARGNRIAPSALPVMAQRSVARLLELLGPPEKDGDALDSTLMKALRDTAGALSQLDSTQDNTKRAKKLVHELIADAEAGQLTWGDWVKAQKLDAGKPGRAAVAPLQDAAARVEQHPRLHAELRELTSCLYQAARQGLESYDQWKQRRRIVDFVDMLDRALSLVSHDEVRSELAERFELLVVDEFQDTSPVQLALFVRLHELAGRSTWVGDRKQCIFEYAGADPELMEAVSQWARESGGAVEQLPNNWRSRPVLVDCFNAVFSVAFRRHGYSAEEVCTTAQRPKLTELSGLPPLGFWSLTATSVEDEAAAIAEGVRRLLAEPEVTPVHDRTTNSERNLRAGDIAILVATNDEAAKLADALAPRGVRAALARTGLLATPEGVLTTAALRNLLEPGDALSAAQIEALTGYAGLEPEAWLDQRLAAEAQGRAAREAGGPRPHRAQTEYLLRLDKVRLEVHALSPSEAVDRVLACLDLAALCRRWPDPAQRLANLDALRGLAADYEARCAQSREAATVAGLLRYLDDATQKTLINDEELASDDQHTNSGPDAVTIVTYHRAKGLEWPVVILGSLHRERRRDAFKVSPETDHTAFDPKDPLGGRWIRYWPWPFAPSKTGPLKDRAAASPEGLAITHREDRERVRLLYVGFTRARDHLILAARTSKEGHKTAWLNELQDGAGAPIVKLPSGSQIESGCSELVIATDAESLRVPARCWSLAADAPLPVADVAGPRLWFAPPDDAPPDRVPYGIAPSRAVKDWPELRAPVPSEVVSFGPRLPLGAVSQPDWNIVGDAVHAFLAADVAELDAEQRLARATRLLAASNLLDVLAAPALLRAADSLKTWIDSRWPLATWHREVPITALAPAVTGCRRVDGTIDLLLELPEGVVLMDHKTYPGGRDTWMTKAAEFGPQFAVYTEALRFAGKTVLEQWVCFAIAGGAVRMVEVPATVQ